MGRYRGALVVAILVIGGCGGGREIVREQEPSPFPELDAYGTWLDDPELGEVWKPRVGASWQPFTEGRWVCTDQGWLWYSDEPFGWIVYHYGSWVDGEPAGWLWVPGYEWSPARVQWAWRDDMIGWAPLPPPGRTIPVAVEQREWVIVPSHKFTSRNVGLFRGPGFAPDRGGVRDHPPDVKSIEQATNVPVQIERVDKVNINRGSRQLIRLRMSGQGSTGPREQVTPPAVPVPSPPHPPVKPEVSPPAAKPIPQETPPVAGQQGSERPVVKGRKPPALRKERALRPEQPKKPDVRKANRRQERSEGKGEDKKGRAQPYGRGEREKRLILQD